MSDGHDHEDEIEPWLSLTSWEQQCVEELEGSPDLESQTENEKDCLAQKLWFLFQNAATCIAQLYKDRQNGVSIWVPFQNAAGSVTSLYKECIESQKRVVDMGFQWGYQRRNKDLIAWAKRRKQHIRREDLIAFLSGRTPPQHIWNNPRQRLSYDGIRTPPTSLARITVPPDSEVLLPDESREPDLETFREAIALSSLNCTMSGTNVSLRQHSSGSPTSGLPRGLRSRNCSQTTTSLAELNAFITEEFTRHTRKRSPPTDVIMDSPTHKRSRLT
ncbi:HUWE1-associated protein modifying stress responses-like [Centruroides vittatus]|uniref:UPF0472 protein C16orf72 homolog n=1 Tax=Centruroides sculpturatus TaxID=218467 RepID=UPI000C6EE36F|nr:UPF0472 protein C16orf72 homolog [Centruroides sculpturatus]